jgi:hypothetical protein
MEEYIECDAHKQFSVFVTMNERGEYGAAQRVAHALLRAAFTLV